MLIAFFIVFSTNSNAIQLLGVPSCGQWNSTDDHAWHHAWLFGYMNGAAAGMNADILKDTDRESIFLWVDNYCRKNPTGKIDEAGRNLALELIKSMH